MWKDSSELDLVTCTDVLNIPFDASPEQVREAYVNLCQLWQPEKYIHNPAMMSQAKAKRQEIELAYEFLKASFRQRDLAKPTLTVVAPENGEKLYEMQSPVRAPQGAHLYWIMIVLAISVGACVLFLWRQMHSGLSPQVNAMADPSQTMNP